MSEDRLDKALEAITNENVDAGELAGAHDRVWEKLAGPGEALCAEFQTQFRGYMDGKLDERPPAADGRSPESLLQMPHGTRLTERRADGHSHADAPRFPLAAMGNVGRRSRDFDGSALFRALLYGYAACTGKPPSYGSIREREALSRSAGRPGARSHDR